jgi:SAM-dependent methyltransferase
VETRSAFVAVTQCRSGAATGGRRSPGTLLEEGVFDVSVCSFGLSDIDNLGAALRCVARTLDPAGRFVFSILHPRFPGGGQVSVRGPTNGIYYNEGW